MKDITVHSNLKALGGVGVPGNLDTKKIGVEEGGPSFSDTLSTSLEKVNELQKAERHSRTRKGSTEISLTARGSATKATPPPSSVFVRFKTPERGEAEFPPLSSLPVEAGLMGTSLSES